VVRQNLAAYVEEPLCVEGRAALRRHVERCEGCHQEYEYLARLSSPLRNLPRQPAPRALAISIRLAAPAQNGLSVWDRWQVRLSNLMRPVALPAAGGLLAALILFAVLIPGVFTKVAVVDDIPTVLMTGPRVKTASLMPVYEDLLVEAWVDQQGRMTSFEILNDTGHSGPELEQELHNQLSNVLFTTSFLPATEFGQPTAGRVILSLRPLSRITIRG
jgi:hypothetical protein